MEQLLPVHSYDADWYPKTNANRIRIWVVGVNYPWEPPINSETEFLALLLMLAKPGVAVDKKTGNVHIPQRPAGT